MCELLKAKEKRRRFRGKKRLGTVKNPLQVYMEVVDTAAHGQNIFFSAKFL